MRILLTGASGFIGKHIYDTFKSHGHSVCKLSYRDTFPDVAYDILSNAPDVTIHCGWHGGNSYIDTNSFDQYHKNIPNSIKLLNLLKRIGNHHFFGFGTSIEYGKKNEIIKETEQEIPENLYGVSKLFLKEYSKLFCEMHGIDWTWIRPFYVYGPGDVPTRLIPRVIQSGLIGKKLELDECKSIIDYMYIDDFTEALYKLVIGKHTGVYNICSGNQYVIKSVVNEIVKLLDNKIEVEFGKIQSRGKSFICGENTKLTSTINWHPQFNLTDGLSKTIEYNKSKLWKGF